MTLQMVRLRTADDLAAEAGPPRAKAREAVPAVSPRPLSNVRAYGS
ncbi:hypothetical protein [Streptomyces sp. NPDC056844]